MKPDLVSPGGHWAACWGISFEVGWEHLSDSAKGVGLVWGTRKKHLPVCSPETLVCSQIHSLPSLRRNPQHPFLPGETRTPLQSFCENKCDLPIHLTNKYVLEYGCHVLDLSCALQFALRPIKPLTHSRRSEIACHLSPTLQMPLPGGLQGKERRVRIA